MAFESTTIQQIHQHILELSALITQQSDAFKPLLQPLSVSGTPEASAVLSLQSFSMGLASHVLDLEKALIQWMADESTLRALDAKDGQ
ncbi:hypothetical protein [Curtobacterium sp. ME12]|uniref:hypothetical protein n=1 Tax=Curtobacterium sp. ME12 TaxID=2744253 RepID=UPI0015F5916A|nr:hypothetical protein [Curtobacterium sp. ME12]